MKRYELGMLWNYYQNRVACNFKNNLFSDLVITCRRYQYYYPSI